MENIWNDLTDFNPSNTTTGALNNVGIFSLSTVFTFIVKLI